MISIDLDKNAKVGDTIRVKIEHPYKINDGYHFPYIQEPYYLATVTKINEDSMEVSEPI